MLPEADDHFLFVGRYPPVPAGLATCRQIIGAVPFFPFGDRLGIDSVPLSKHRE